MNWLRANWRKFCRWRASWLAYRTEWCEDLPERLRTKSIYVVGGKVCPYQAVVHCPCGCKEAIYVDVANQSKAKWSLTTHSNESISLHPSVWRTVGCRSHFLVRRGKVIWC